LGKSQQERSKKTGPMPIATDSAYHYMVLPESETNYFVHGNDPNYSPNNVTVHQNKVPDWILAVSIPEIPNPDDANDRLNSNLLCDYQIDISSKTFYEHRVYKIWNAFDLWDHSNLSINFDPDYETLTLHECKVYRNGTWIDKLEMNELRVIQPEFDLDSNIYSAYLSALLFLEDIREGDILDYSYSLSGTPLPRISLRVPLQYESRWEKNHLRIVKPDGRLIHSQISPSDWGRCLIDNEHEFVWEIEPCLPYDEEPDQPPVYRSQKKIELSEFSSWGDVASHFVPFYRLNDDFQHDAEVIEQIRIWKEQGATIEEQAILAIRYVQDEIRYTGIETGKGGFQPTDPLVTLKRRFGDCKGKSQLMRAFLKMLDVHSDVCLVSTKSCAAIKNDLPNPWNFDHAILQVELSGQTAYVDATALYEGGDLSQMSCPFGAGLVISEETQDLVTIPMPIIHPEIQCHTSFDLETGDDVTMNTVIHFYGTQANTVRSIWKSEGLNFLSEHFQNYFETQFSSCTPGSSTRIEDDRTNNHLTLSIDFILEDPWTNTRKKNNKYLNFTPYFLIDYLGQQIDVNRQTPLQLDHQRIKETVSVKGGHLLTNNVTIEHDIFTFNCLTKDNQVEFELFTNLDELLPEDFDSYLEKLDEAVDEIDVLIKRR
jgi:hypothetical protein